MRFDLYSMKWIIALVALLATAIVSAGCGGGGGGGGGGGSTGTTYSYSGTVINSTTGAALSGYTVSLNGNSAYEATTNSSGKFTISGVPASAVPTSSVSELVVTNSSGEQGSYAIAAGTAGVSGITIEIGPPPPPSTV